MLLSSSATSNTFTGLAALAVVEAAAVAVEAAAGAGAEACSCLPHAARAKVTLAASSSGFKCL